MGVDTTDFEAMSQEDASNELQRFYNLVKVGAPTLGPPEVVKYVIFEDWKCPTTKFRSLLNRNSYGVEAKPVADVVTCRHPQRWHKPLQEEFDATIIHVRDRHGRKPVFSDIERLAKFLGPSRLSESVDMPDVVCMWWRKGDAANMFAERWFSYTANYSMRVQLTFNAAIADTESDHHVEVKYLPLSG